MKALELIQRDVISANVKQRVLREGLSPNSTEAQSVLKQELMLATGKPIFSPRYARSGELDPTLITSQFKDIELDLMVALEATEQLDKDSSLVSILSDIEHRSNQASINRHAVLTSYLKLGGLTFGDTFSNADYIEVEKSSATVDSALGAVRHKSELIKDALELPSQELRLNPASPYTAVSGLSSPLALLQHRGPYTVIFQTRSDGGFTVNMSIKLSSTSPVQTKVNRILTLRSVVGYINASCAFEVAGRRLSVIDTMIGSQQAPIMLPNDADTVSLSLTKTFPDLSADGYSYYVFSLADMYMWSMCNTNASSIITKEVKFLDLSGSPIPLDKVTVVTRTNKNINSSDGLVQPYVAVCGENQPIDSLSWLPIIEGSPTKLADSYTGTFAISSASIQQLSSTELQLADLRLIPGAITVLGGKGCMTRASSTNKTNTSVEVTGTPSYKTLSNVRYIVFTWDELKLLSGDIIPAQGAIEELTINGRQIQTNTYSIVGVIGQRQLWVPLEAVASVRHVRYLDDESYTIKLNVETTIEEAAGPLTGKVILKAGAQTILEKKSGSSVVIKLFNLTTGATTVLKEGEAVKLTGPTTTTIEISGYSGGSIANHFTTIDTSNIFAEGALTRTNGRPRVGEVLEFNGVVIVGSPTNKMIFTMDSGTRVNTNYLLTTPELYYELHYTSSDTSKTRVRLKFDILPYTDSFQFLEYVAAFKPVGVDEEAELAYSQPDNSLVTIGSSIFGTSTIIGRPSLPVVAIDGDLPTVSTYKPRKNIDSM